MHLKLTPNDLLDVAGTVYRVKLLLGDQIKLMRLGDAAEYYVEDSLLHQLLYAGFLKRKPSDRGDAVESALGLE